MATIHVAAPCGDATYLGDYPDVGTYNGAREYQLDASHYLVWDAGDVVWTLLPAPGSTGSGNQYQSPDGNISTVPTTGWIAVGGAAPAPTVSIIGASHAGDMFLGG